jgi:hypothetical protein
MQVFGAWRVTKESEALGDFTECYMSAPNAAHFHVEVIASSFASTDRNGCFFVSDPFVAQHTRFAEGHLWVAAQRHPLLPAGPVVAEMPGLASCRRHGQTEAIQIREGVGLAGGFGLSNCEVGERHALAPEHESGTRCWSHEPRASIHNPESAMSVKMDLFLDLKVPAGSGFQWLSPESKAGQ